MIPIEEEGRFRGVIISHGCQESKTSQSMGISMLCHLTHRIVDGVATEMDPGKPMSAEGTVWIIGKDGRSLITSEEAFCTATGWDGDLEKIAGTKEWVSNPIEFEVKAEEYNDKVKYRMAFLEPVGGKKLGAQSCSPNKLERIKAKMAAAKTAALLPQAAPIGGEAPF